MDQKYTSGVPTSQPRHGTKVSGFTLIEVMVALIVLSVGMAGVAALLVKGMQASSIANLHSVATTHAQTGVEIMRANLPAYIQGWYAGSNTSTIQTPVSCSGSTGCSETEQATNDFVTWQDRIAASMPNGQGFLCTDSTPNDGQPGDLQCDGNGNNVVKIFWADSRDAATLDPNEDFHRFATRVNP